MASLAELIEQEHARGPGVDVSELERRQLVLSKLQPIPVTKGYDSNAFYPWTNIEDLRNMSDKGDYIESNKFRSFLYGTGIISDAYMISNVLKLLTSPRVFGRDLKQPHTLTIQDVQKLVSTNLIQKLDGFDDDFNLKVV